MSKRIHKLDLYRLAVQHPEAEVMFLLRCYEYYERLRERQGLGSDNGEFAGLLREDFCGGSALAATWVGFDDDYQAMGVDFHGPTLQWAFRKWKKVLGERFEDLHLVESDVMEVDGPAVDVINASNFSVFYFHERQALVDYFKLVAKCLRKGGIFAMDAFGGAGAMKVGTQVRQVEVGEDEVVDGFAYEWEQKSYDAVTGRVDCRIHFEMDDGKRKENAFRYDWRLWTLMELKECMLEAGFRWAEVWGGGDRGDGRFQVLKKMPATDEWVVYVVGAK